VLWRPGGTLLNRSNSEVRYAAADLGKGGSITFVASKNALAAGENGAACSTAKAAEVHLARCLAEKVETHRSASIP
jgi:NAD(P)-dependent dehydrogenase (short-subunit alcohol dehydrogenase family)